MYKIIYHQYEKIALFHPSLSMEFGSMSKSKNSTSQEPPGILQPLFDEISFPIHQPRTKAYAPPPIWKRAPRQGLPCDRYTASKLGTEWFHIVGNTSSIEGYPKDPLGRREGEEQIGKWRAIQLSGSDASFSSDRQVYWMSYGGRRSGRWRRVSATAKTVYGNHFGKGEKVPRVWNSLEGKGGRRKKEKKTTGDSVESLGDRGGSR